MPTDSIELPNSFYWAAILLGVLTLESLRRWRWLCAMFALLVYFTIGMWYFVDILYIPERYNIFPAEDLEISFWQVTAFLLVFRMGLQMLIRFDRQITGDVASSLSKQMPVNLLLRSVLFFWAVLFVCGLIRMKGDLFATLYPIQGRWGSHMWGRGSLGGEWGWAVAAGGYLYVFICGLLGLMLVLVQDRAVRLTLLVLIAISWPYFFFLGVRNMLLAIISPGLFAFLLVSKTSLWRKMVGGAVVLLVLNYVMLAMLQNRLHGFQEFLKDPFTSVDTGERHEGLNMLQELIFVNGYMKSGQLEPEYGVEYLAQALNLVPRAIWPNKPLLSFRYSVLRGYSARGEDWIIATISTGLVGQGVVNFGPWFGPAVAAVLMLFLGGYLIRQWSPGSHPLRFFLFLMGLGIVPNLGREFTLLVLWPVIFGAIMLRIIERQAPMPLEPASGSKPAGPRTPAPAQSSRPPVPPATGEAARVEPPADSKWR